MASRTQGPLFGGIEAGGTKFICAVGRNPDLLDVAEIPTTDPVRTIRGVLEFFQSRGAVAAVGIASFGPVDLNPDSPTFGYITSTPKDGWRNVDLAGAIRSALSVPVAFDTDVNAAALAEYRWGAAQGLQDFLYVTVGTGIGGGAMINGRLLHGRGHPEMGHVRIPHDITRDRFPGDCPYHGDCLEGLASAPAISNRWGQAAHLLPSLHPAWDLEAHYLALGMVNWISTLAPERIILGGGVMRHEGLLENVRSRVAALLNEYGSPPDIVSPGLGDRSGVLGAIALAEADLAAPQ